MSDPIEDLFKGKTLEELEELNRMTVADPEAFEKECEEMNKHIDDYLG